MSAKIYWRPVENNWTQVEVVGSSMWEILGKAFGHNGRHRLDETDIDKLEGIVAAGVTGASAIIAAIEVAGEIELKLES